MEAGSKIRIRCLIPCAFLLLVLGFTHNAQLSVMANAGSSDEITWSEYNPIYLLGNARVYMRWQIDKDGRLIGILNGTAGKEGSWCSGEVIFDGRSTDGGYLYSCHSKGDKDISERSE